MGLRPPVSLDMGLLGFQVRPVSGPEIANFEGLSGPKPLQNASKMVGRFAPQHFGLVLKRLKAVYISKSAISGPETGRL
jgi:hypothetical protein